MACGSAPTGTRFGCDDLEETVYGALHQRRLSGVCDSRGVESGGRSRKGSLGAALAQAAGTVSRQRARALDRDRDE